jgi:COP9 signalosome complex subunit 4
VARQLLATFAAEVPQRLAADMHKAVAAHALERVVPRLVSFENEATTLRESLAAVHEAEEDWSKAAQVLGSIDLDSGSRRLDNEYKLEKCVKIARLYLEDDDAVKAEAHIKKASFLLPKEPALASVEAKVLTLQYKVCYARIQDSKRRFLEAALRYYELSQVRVSHASWLISSLTLRRRSPVLFAILRSPYSFVHSGLTDIP